jgi:hypothetical protein
MAGARSLWRATGMQDGDFEKPIIAVVNSFTQFVPGHVHLKDMGQLVAREIERAGAVAKEFNAIAVDDGIAMGHDGMLYSLPSRDLIADSVEYMCNAHTADAMVCIFVHECREVLHVAVPVKRFASENAPAQVLSSARPDAFERPDMPVVTGFSVARCAGDTRARRRMKQRLPGIGAPGSCEIEPLHGMVRVS